MSYNPRGKQSRKQRRSRSRRSRSPQSPRSPLRQRRRRKRTPPLKKVYGFYKCNNCFKIWESAYTWKVKGTEKIYYKQDCKSCGYSKFPYHHEPIVCSICYQEKCRCYDCDDCYPYDCECECEDCGEIGNECICFERHSDPTKNHKQELCHKCRNKSQPCSSNNYHIY
mmetsp:Transcript_18775/g.16714  ORF Transcript_18775/g.16714 Transcript_18775/m.16714 type:complete len:168 (+) Transcript_18775:56-559(+)